MRINRIYLIAGAFLAPALISVIILRLWPAVDAVHRSLLAPRAINYSLENYIFIFTDPVFLNSLWVTVLYNVIVNPLQIAIALGLALLMNNQLRTSGFWRSVILLPAAIPPSVATVVWGVMYRPDGLFNGLFEALGLPSQRFLTSPDQALASIILMVTWIGVGYWMTFLLAGLQDIPRSLYEAAEIDGLNKRQKFFYITLPLLRRPLTFVLVADTVANFLLFAPVQILTKGGPVGSTNLIMNEIYGRAFVTGDKSSAAAATVVLMLLVLIVVAAQFRMMGREANHAG